MTSQQVNIGPRIVRAWFDSIFNPLIEALESEIATLRERNFTWRFRPAGFEWIRHIANHLDPRSWPNLEQLLSLRPELAALFREHDSYVDVLQKEVQGLQDLITGSPEFQGYFESIIAPESLRQLSVSSPNELFGAYPREDWAKVVAQYMINNSGELLHHYSTAKLWNAYRPGLLQLVHATVIEVKYNSVLRHAGQLSDIDASLLDYLRDLRLKLSQEHDQPFVEPERYRS